MAVLRQSAPVVETVSRRRVLSAEEVAQQEQPKADLWEFLAAIKPEDWELQQYSIYLYRLEPRMVGGSSPTYLDKIFDGTIEMPDGRRLPFSMEAIKHKYGGRVFRIFFKRGAERIYDIQVANEAPPKYPDSMLPGFASSVAAPSAPDNSAVAAKALEMVGNQQPEALRLGIQAMQTATQMVLQKDPLTEKLVTIAVERMMNPPQTLQPTPDPLKEKLLTLAFERLFAPPATSGVKDTLEMISALKTAGIFGTGGDVGFGTELARALPGVLNGVKESIQEWRLGMEAHARAAEVARTPIAIAPSSPPTNVAAERAANVPAESAPTAAAQAAPTTGPLEAPLDFVELKIVELLAESESVEDAADEAVELLHRIAPSLLSKLVELGENGILGVFQQRHVLRQVPITPKLHEFVKLFAQKAKEMEAARAAR